MTDTLTRAWPYIRKAGEARKLLVAGQSVHMLAGEADTDGAYGVVICESVHDKRPIPLHYHDREHDTWLCLRGRLKIWAKDTARVLTEGDFAYVPPGDIHSYQCVAPVTRFFGVVAPGGWEGFFDMAGEPWAEDGLPELDHPYDFSKMGPAMGKFDVHPVQQDYVEAVNGDATDRALPASSQSYILQSGYGDRYRVGRHLATALLTHDLSAGSLDMFMVEGGRGARMPLVSHEQTHITLFIVEGEVEVTLDGIRHVLGAGDLANIPAGTVYDTCVKSGAARWVSTGGNGNGGGFWAEIGEPTNVTHFHAKAEVAAGSFATSKDARFKG